MVIFSVHAIACRLLPKAKLSHSCVRSYCAIFLLVLSLSGIAAQSYMQSIEAALETAGGSPMLGRLAVPASTSKTAFDGYVRDTLVLNNGSLVQGNISPFNGNTIAVPTAIAYDSRDNRIYVTSGRSPVSARSANLVSIIDGTTNKLLRSVPVADPRGITYGPTSGYVYVASTLGATILNGATAAVMNNVTLGGQTSGLVFDPSNR